ncbi:ATP adenylyltransferase [Phycisphaerales bacterium]|nr:ATP adenylyltransferase [Phycisphaerales bacterium]
MARCPLCDIASRSPAPDSGHIAALDQCLVVLGDNQGCPGWCVLILREHVEHMDLLGVPRQRAVFGEVARVAAAIRRVFPTSGAGGGPVRINYECLGNQVPHVHWHVIPRHADDPEPRNAVWGWEPQRLRGDLSPDQRRDLARRIAGAMT